MRVRFLWPTLQIQFIYSYNAAKLDNYVTDPGNEHEYRLLSIDLSVTSLSSLSYHTDCECDNHVTNNKWPK